MKVRVVNRRLTGAGALMSRNDNIFNQISELSAPQAVTGRAPDARSADVLRPSVFSTAHKERVSKTSPAQMQGLSCAADVATVITRSGAKPIEDIHLGDMVLTRDNGFQPVLWMKRVDAPSSAPMTVEIQVDAIDSGIPVSSLLVSGRQGILLTCPDILEKFGTTEVLVRAGDLLHLDGVRQVNQSLTGIAIMTQRHELISVNGMWVESFAPDTTARKCLNETEQAEILRLVPGLTDLPFERSYPNARTILRREFARQFQR